MIDRRRGLHARYGQGESFRHPLVKLLTLFTSDHIAPRPPDKDFPAQLTFYYFISQWLTALNKLLDTKETSRRRRRRATKVPSAERCRPFSARSVAAKLQKTLLSIYLRTSPSRGRIHCKNAAWQKVLNHKVNLWRPQWTHHYDTTKCILYYIYAHIPASCLWCQLDIVATTHSSALRQNI